MSKSSESRLFTKILNGALAVTLLGFGFVACAKQEGAGDPPMKSLDVPADGKAFITIRSDMKVEEIYVQTADGTKMEPCQLCSPELEERYGENCADGIAKGEVCPNPEGERTIDTDIQYFPVAKFPNPGVKLGCIKINHIIWCP